MHQIHLVWFMTMSKTMDICYSQWTIAKFGMQRSLSLNQKDFAAAVEIFIYPPSTRPQNSCDCGTAQTLMQVIFVSTSKISMGTCPSLLCTLILPPRHMVFTHSLHMMPFTMMLTTLVEREKQEPTLLELYFYNTDPSLNYKLGKCLIRPYKKIDRSFISWLTSSVPTLISTRIIYEIGGECFRLPYRVQPWSTFGPKSI
jgi:hypothetical protein